MSKKADNRITVEVLKNRIIFIVNFMKANSDNPLPDEVLVRTIENVKKTSSLKMLQTVNRDLQSWIKDFSPAKRDKLSAKLDKMFPETPFASTEVLAGIILKKGSIDNIEEYEIIHNFLQDLTEEDKYFGKFEDLGNLLVRYDKENKK